jgi:hypothetical protein
VNAIYIFPIQNLKTGERREVRVVAGNGFAARAKAWAQLEVLGLDAETWAVMG